MMKLAVLFLQYDTEKYPAALQYLHKYLDRIKDKEKQVFVIDNKTETNIAGDNSVWEFSGWDAGVRYLNQNNIDYDAILFINDSFLAPSGYKTVIDIISDRSVANCINNDDVIGHVLDADYNNVLIGDHYIQHYMRTHCFMLSKKTVDKVKTLVSLDIDFLDKCIDKEPSFPYIKDDAPLNGVARRNIVNNMTRHWHSAFKPYDNWELFRMKTLMLMNEQVLYTRIHHIMSK